MTDLLPPAVRKAIYAVAIPANAFIIAMGWSGNRWVLGVLAATVMEAFAELTDRHDAAIHAAAGLAWPPPTAIAAEVKRIDRTLLVTEWRDLMGGLPLPNAGAYADATPLQRLIVPVSDWRVARAMLSESKMNAGT